ncbi:hypothetical protein AZZ66_004829 [Escherichia coli]|nr:hypothetical protein AZZ66_004829 [Escherichia coli]
MPERENYQQVTLQARLVSALETLNPNVPSDTLIEVAKIVATPQTPVLIKNNKLFHQYLIEGVPVEYSVMEQEQWVTKHTHVRLIDFVLWSTKTGHRVRVFSSIGFLIRLVVTHHYIRAVLVLSLIHI